MRFQHWQNLHIIIVTILVFTWHRINCCTRHRVELQLVRLGQGKTMAGTEIVEKTESKIREIRQQMRVPQLCQQQHENKRRKPLKFKLGDMVMLKVSPWKCLIRFGKRESLVLNILDLSKSYGDSQKLYIDWIYLQSFKLSIMFSIFLI